MKNGGKRNENYKYEKNSNLKSSGRYESTPDFV